MDDPAWLYSTIAQVSAAIVGLVGAILGARLIDQVKVQQEERKRLALPLIDHAVILKNTVAKWEQRLVELDGANFSAVDREEQRQHVKTLIRLAPKFRGPIGELDLTELREEITRLGNSHDSAYLGTDAQAFLHRLQTLKRQIDGYRSGLLPWTFFLVFGILGWLSLFGILWPLMALPGLPTPSFFAKTWVLLAFAFGLVALVAYFMRLLSETRKLGK